MNNNQKFVILGLLSTAAALLCVLVLTYGWDDAIAQERAAAGPPSMVAATGACGVGSEIGVLYVIDTERKQLAVYGAFQGRALEFLAARRIFYDLELLEFNDATPPAFSVKNLRQAFEAHSKKKDGTEKEPPRRR